MKCGAKKRRQWRTRIFSVVLDSEKLVGDTPFAVVPDFAYADACLFVTLGWGENITDRERGGRAQIQISLLPELRR